MKTMYPNYERSVLSITNSILAHYGINPYHTTLPELDNTIRKNFRNIVLMIFDGMGSSILKNHLNADDFLRGNLRSDISSVFPPTTTAATISMHTGLSPIEHGWLGWSLYFKEIDKNVNIFTNVIGGTKNTQAADFNVAQKYIPYNSIFCRIMERNKDVKAEFIAPFTEHRVKSVSEICDTVRRICKEQGQHFLLTYWDNPDSDMHLHGTCCDSTRSIMCDINRQIEILSNGLSDTLLIITADHGQIDTEYKFISDFPSVSECLVRPESIETRAANFFVKQDKKVQFETEFNRHFGTDFILFTKEQVLEQKLFGEGTPHKKAYDFLGDYLAVATGNLSLDYTPPTYRDVYKGQHAGLTEDEMIVPLIIIER